jgi:hypothetical protein
LHLLQDGHFHSRSAKPNPNTYRDIHPDTNGYIYSHTYSDGYLHSDADANRNPVSVPKPHADSNWDAMCRNHQPAATAGQHGNRRSEHSFLIHDHSNSHE